MTNPFTAEIVSWAQAAEKVYQIPASLNLSAAKVESNLGAATPPGSNNWHGIKDPKGVATSTNEQTAGGVVYTIQAGFMIFKSPADSFMYYGHLLGLYKPYHDMVTTFLKSPRAPTDVQALSNSLTGVYATAIKYGEALIAAQKQYNLYQYDTLAAPQPSQPPVPVPAQPKAPPVPGLPNWWTTPMFSFSTLFGLLTQAPAVISDIEELMANPQVQALEQILASLFSATTTPGAAAVIEPITPKATVAGPATAVSSVSTTVAQATGR
ncbi:MAG: glucosaminidase domain-containing protein [Anaerolineaceae bacterium]|nr:glucosaminidase domain-containing protein [Anaerolineaceae bacterium]